MLRDRPTSRNKNNRSEAAFALLLTMIVLVVLVSVAAGLSMQLTMSKHRQQYMIEYQRARYGLDSAMKYMLSELPVKSFAVKPRPDVPDFSDIFWMSNAEYAQFVTSWAATATDEQLQAVIKEDAQDDPSDQAADEGLMSWLGSLFTDSQSSDSTSNSYADPNSDPNSEQIVQIEPNDIEVPGPYGAQWPYVEDPIELEIGTSRITITIEDENAKMPLSWLVTTFDKVNEQAAYSLQTFGSWMKMAPEDMAELKTSLDQIYEQKMYKVNPNTIILQAAAQPAQTNPAASQFSTSRKTYTRTAPAPNASPQQQPQQQPGTQAAPNQRPAYAHATDFAKLFHSSLLNHEALARSLPDTGERIENALKYLSLWGSQRVNINTAPRHVLEAAFMLGGDGFMAPELAQKVIEIRKEKPFNNIDELKNIGMIDGTTFENIKNYVTASSTFFKVRVTSSSGNARASAVATVIKEGKNMQTLAIMYGY